MEGFLPILFYLLNEDDKARTDFIKEKYGIGGQSHALCGADNSHADYDGKGLKLRERGLWESRYFGVAALGKSCKKNRLSD